MGELQILEAVTGALWVLSFEEGNAVRMGEATCATTRFVAFALDVFTGSSLQVIVDRGLKVRTLSVAWQPRAAGCRTSAGC
jgi:hypothetical protein